MSSIISDKQKGQISCQNHIKLVDDYKKEVASLPLSQTGLYVNNTFVQNFITHWGTQLVSLETIECIFFITPPQEKNNLSESLKPLY